MLAWSASANASELFISVLVVGEIRHGIERLRRRDPLQSDAIERWLEQLKTDFAERLIGVSAAVAERWGRLNAARTLPTIDGLIAATAIEHDLTLVTRGLSASVPGLRLLNPWA